MVLKVMDLSISTLQRYVQSRKSWILTVSTLGRCGSLEKN